MPSAKEGNDFRVVAYESLLERDFIQLLEDDHDVVSYADRSEPVVWIDRDGVTRRYYPDFDVLRRDDLRTCVEVKPLDRILKHDLLLHYEQIERYAIGSGRFARFEIWTDREIRDPIPLYNAELRNVGRLNREPMPFSVSIVSALRGLGGRATLGDLRDASGLGRDAFWAVVRSLARDVFRLEEPHRPIDDRSVVRLEVRS
ncbi:hypothetical protein GGQ76_002772 [Aureimonas jatrophae]|uniref:hypothetical protein n=1 Tax=Aureimonas jatrophae TaxID=1166073 RepID=UPI0016069731|nr:hypothetical protein [Aureimonas jatrophae]MBB3951474.1 hypothetical protein [Aureimonas jatrophae]